MVEASDCSVGTARSVTDVRREQPPLRVFGYRNRVPRKRALYSLIASLVFAMAGLALGALPLSAAEPDGLYVNCGPALFGRPFPLPDPACLTAYEPLPALSIALCALGALCAVAPFAARLAPRRKVE